MLRWDFHYFLHLNAYCRICWPCLLLHCSHWVVCKLMLDIIWFVIMKHWLLCICILHCRWTTKEWEGGDDGGGGRGDNDGEDCIFLLPVLILAVAAFHLGYCITIWVKDDNLDSEFFQTGLGLFGQLAVAAILYIKATCLSVCLSVRAVSRHCPDLFFFFLMGFVFCFLM
jgi:hypothetical protein